MAQNAKKTASKSNKTQGKPQANKTAQAKKSSANKQQQAKPVNKKEISPYTNEIIGISFLGIGAILIAFMFSDSQSKNLASYITAFLSHLFGVGGIILPFILIVLGILIFIDKGNLLSKFKTGCWIGTILTALAFIHIIACEDGTSYGTLANFIRHFFLNGSTGNGGLIGALLGGAIVRLIGKIPACIICIIIFIIAIILLFDVSIFNAMKSLGQIMLYRNDYDDDYEEPAPKKAVSKKAVRNIPPKYENMPAADDTASLNRIKGNIFSKRAERPVFEEQNIAKGKGKAKLSQKAEATPAASPYLTDKKGKVLALDLHKTNTGTQQGISIFPAEPVTRTKPSYNPNDENDDINKLFTEDSEAEYDRLLREAEDLLTEDLLEDDEITETPIKAEPVRSVPASPVKASINQATEDVDTPPWEEPAEKPQIIQAEKTKEFDTLNVSHTETYKFPKLEFLGVNKNINAKQTEAEMILKGEKLRKTLLNFNVEAKVDNICTGPTVTRYELIPKEGTRVQTITKLEQDIALSLAAATVRIEAPIPGKSAIGIEIPNETIQSVYYSEVLRNEKFQNFKSKITFGIGKDIAGNVVVYDIAKAPHMLIAGATGAGKSVCVNTLITSILYKATPDEVRLIMVDPKVVELSVYNGIPHLLIPVVTDPKKASGALNWAVREMMRRYDLFATTGTRNLEGYNKHEGIAEKLPQIVIIIDELADLMMVAKKEVEDSICRLAQLARAAGIHLIIATQRPSVDVITGLIKANIPSRIAFKVSSGTDSRTVLDTTGAEKLLGRGDMLFKAVDMNKPLRIQGAFVTDEEVATIVNYIKTDIPNYDTSVMEDIENAEKSDNIEGDIQTNDSDELIDQVIDFIVRSKKASASAIQRKFRIGFNRAGRIIDELEERGIVGPDNGSKPREVLMTPYERSEYKERHENY